MRLGRRPRPHGARFLRLADHLAAPLPPAPPAWDGMPGATIAPYGNDRLGDCTIAAVANLASIQAAGEGMALSFTEAEVVSFYEGRTGGQDTGLVEVDVLRYVQKHGFPGSGRWKLRAWAAVDHTDHAQLRAAAATFQGLYLGVDLPDDWGAGVRAGRWDVTGEPNIDNGHALVVAGFDPTGYSLATWGSIIRATPAWLDRYCVEAYVLLDETRLGVDVLSGAGLIEAAAQMAAETGTGG